MYGGFGQAGVNASMVAQKEAILNAMKATRDDQVLAQKELVKEQIAGSIFMDRVTGQAYRMLPTTIMSGVNFALLNTVGSGVEEVIFNYQVPQGIEYLVAQPTGRMGDYYSPYLWGQLNDGASAPANINNGILRMRVFDAGGDTVKETILNIGTEAFNGADANDLNLRLYFNSPQPVRARDGDIIRGIIISATAMVAANSRVVMQLIKLTKVAGGA